ncbi:MAG: hypothetical protein MJZ15_09295 [Bacteroidales bacterium]|nr:hypothetical protein [Bacteroidales bacterium]
MTKHLKWFSQLAMALTMAVGFTSCEDEDNQQELGNWIRVDASFPGTTRGGAVCFQIGNTAYIGTGANTTKTEEKERYRDFYSCTTDGEGGLAWSARWERTGNGVTSMPEVYTENGEVKKAAAGRNGAVAFALNGKGYVGLGYAGNNYLKDFWEYDPNGIPDANDYPSLPADVKAKFGSEVTGSWRKIADYPGDSCVNAVAFVLHSNKDNKDYAYVGTGQDYDKNYLCDFYRFDGEKWSAGGAVPPIGHNRARAAAFTYKANDGIEYGYVIGGTDGNEKMDWFQRFNPETNSWEELRRVSDVRRDTYDDYYMIYLSASTAFALPTNSYTAKYGAKAYVTTGGFGGPSRSTWEYDLEGDYWIKKTDFEGYQRMFAVSFILEQDNPRTGEKQFVPYVTTGSDGDMSVTSGGGKFFNDTWLFNPYEAYDRRD